MNLEEYDFDRLLGLGYTEKATGELKDACWKGYTAVGTKKKGGRTVPNCVPVKKSEHAEEMKHKPLIAGPSAGSPSFAESEDETFDFTRCVRPNGTAYGTAGKCKSGSEEAKLERDPSKDVKRGSTLIGTSPRNMSIDTINEYKARLKDARSPQETKLLKDTIKSMEAELKPKARAKKKVASPSAIAREESKLATLEKRLAAANEKMDSARGRASGARLGSRSRLMTASQSRANSDANKEISKAQELENQVREEKS